MNWLMNSVHMLGSLHRVIILNRGIIFAFQWREFSPLLSSAHRLLNRQKIDRRRCNILVGKICITFFPFSCEACSLYLVLWFCGSLLLFKTLIDKVCMILTVKQNTIQNTFILYAVWQNFKKIFSQHLFL